ncbi:S1 family peptidase [Bdellovibrio sp. HCB209]|uniref:S1 family peptidase n=1 Tax=Bdellovibrio sp. HCB209 TaxID=3394354 RepID=UPI0039B5CE01
MSKFGIIFLLILTAACARQAPQSYSLSDINSGKIIGGTAVSETDFARQATVSIYTESRRGLEFVCTGTLISKDLVVTAAHCLQSLFTPLYVSLGEKLPQATQSMIKVSQSTSHPEYRNVQKPGVDGDKYWTTEHDIALLKLSYDAPREFTPIAIHADTDQIPSESKLLLAGFGMTDDETDSRAKSMNQVEVTLNSIVEEFLVIDQTSGKGACFGDSGGPAYLETESGWLVVGATHAARPGYFDCRHFSDYTSLSKYAQYILSVADQFEADLPQFVLPQTSPERPVRAPLAVQ